MQKRSGKGRQVSRGKKKAGGSNKKVFPIVVGKVQMTREGFIFVIVEGQDDDIFVKASKTRHALNGDTVRVAVTREKAGETRRREGEVVEILARSERPFVGYYHTVGARAWVLMQSKAMPYDIRVDAEAAAAMGAQPGMKVAAVVDRWERRDPEPSGHLVDVLGTPGENETEMHAILAEFNLPYRFSSEVENAADKIPDDITDAELKGRKDFRQTFTFTIDPADAKDFDDALSFKPLPNGNYEIGVHIADVSWYVKPGSAVDKEALERGTSVYLVDRTVPMLPEKLCNKLCSLRPHEDKLTFSAVFEMTPKAEIKARWIGRTVINSDYRLDYDQAQRIIETAVGGGELPPETSGVAGPLPSDDGPLPLNVPRVAVFPEAAAASPAAECNNYCEDAIEFLRKTPEGKYDLMIVDPPAFAKHRGALQNALRAYQRLNAAAIAKVAPGGLVFTFSCSQVVDKITFANTVFSAAAQTGRSVRILDRLCQGSDHPVSIYHPEGEYLKGLLLYVE